MKMKITIYIFTITLVFVFLYSLNLAPPLGLIPSVFNFYIKHKLWIAITGTLLFFAFLIIQDIRKNSGGTNLRS
jgi:hypothetical protein